MKVLNQMCKECKQTYETETCCAVCLAWKERGDTTATQMTSLGDSSSKQREAGSIPATRRQGSSPIQSGSDQAGPRPGFHTQAGSANSISKHQQHRQQAKCSSRQGNHRELYKQLPKPPPQDRSYTTKDNEPMTNDTADPGNLPKPAQKKLELAARRSRLVGLLEGINEDYTMSKAEFDEVKAFGKDTDMELIKTWDLNQMDIERNGRRIAGTAASKTYVWIACTKELWACDKSSNRMSFLKRAKKQDLAFWVDCDKGVKGQEKFWVQIRGFRPKPKGRSRFVYHWYEFDVYRPGEHHNVVRCVNLAQIMAEACGKTGGGGGGVDISPAAQEAYDNATAKEVRARPKATNKQTKTQTRWI